MKKELFMKNRPVLVCAALALALAATAATPPVPPKNLRFGTGVPSGPTEPGIWGSAAPVPGTWRQITPISVDLTKNSCTDLKFASSNRSILYLLVGGDFGKKGGLWKSFDGGASWAKFPSAPNEYSVGRILVDPNDPNHLYTSGGVNGPTSAWGFWISHDGGATWTMPPAFAAGAAATWTTDIYNIAVDPEDFNHIVMSSHRGWPGHGEDGGVLESKDGGTTFIAHAPPAGMSHGNGIAILSDPIHGQGNGNTWLVGGGYAQGIFRTSDAGQHWTNVAPALQDNHGGFFASYSAQGYLYIGVRNGLGRSKDNGLTWTHLTGGLGGWYYGAISDGKNLYTSEAFVGTVYNNPFKVSAEGGSDEGSVWAAYSAQTLPQGPFRMVFDGTNKIIYSANWGGGAWALNVLP